MGKGNIPISTDPETAMIDPVKNGVNPFENEGIMPNAQVPKGESAVNVTTPEVDTKSYPSTKGSGY